MKLGIALTHTHVDLWDEAAALADEIGLDSIWLPDHLVLPADLDLAGYPDAKPPVLAPTTPLIDCVAYLGFLAARTTRVGLGTFVYLHGLRHPLVSARGLTTVDVLANGRLELGVGAGWLRSEWDAVGADFATRGARLDEAIQVTRRLWVEDVVEHRGRFWSWAPQRFEPKPARAGGPPILIGGESSAALRRAATLGDGWLSMPHTLDSVRPQLRTLAALREQAGRTDVAFTTTVCTLELPSPGELDGWSEAGVDRLIVRPWGSARDTIPALHRLAARYDGHLRT